MTAHRDFPCPMTPPHATHSRDALGSRADTPKSVAKSHMAEMAEKQFSSGRMRYPVRRRMDTRAGTASPLMPTTRDHDASRAATPTISHPVGNVLHTTDDRYTSGALIQNASPAPGRSSSP